ncbi:MAG TPA: hypothetical protein VE954_03980 [Oligoflexus sp.]|uniref:hypothetical protein n=1 Tax=Oligoflexus sp. TaxID=1971216 RepID=UPI002D5AFA2D|nr:hypothetical protein [Oligoflexus sp.]HYX32246.1 hypothetical protein [Oligoflexus sp.]
MKMIRMTHSLLWLLLSSTALIQGCSDETVPNSRTASVGSVRAESTLLVAPRSDAPGRFDYIALFKTVGPQGKIIGLNMVDCADEKVASALLGIDPKKALFQSFAEYKKVPANRSAELFDATKAASLGLAEEPRLSCDPEARGAEFKPYILSDYSKILLTLNEGAGQYLSLPVSCKGLNRGLDLPRLLKGKRPVDLKRTVEDLGLQEEFVLGCGSFKAGPPAPAPTWDLVYVRSIPPRLFILENHDQDFPMTMEIKRMDGFVPDDLLYAEVNPDDSEEAKTWAAMKARLGIEGPSAFEPGTPIPGVIPELVLDLCVRNCSGFIPQHGFTTQPEPDSTEVETTTVEQLTLLSNRDISGKPYMKWQYGPNTVNSLVFDFCGDDGFNKLLGLKESSDDWTAGNKSHSEWLYAASKALKPGDNRSALSCFKVKSQACVKETKNKKPDETWPQFFSIKDCPQRDRSTITSLEIHLSSRTTLVWDKLPLEITESSLKAGFQSPVNKLLLVGDEPQQASKIERKIDCRKVICQHNQQGPTPALRFSGKITVELRNLSIIRTSAYEAGWPLSALEATGGSQLLLKDVKIGSEGGIPFDTGVRVLDNSGKVNPTTASIIDTDIIARDSNIQVRDSRALVYAAKPETHFLAPVSLKKDPKTAHYLDVEDITSALPVMTGNIVLARQSAFYIENQSLAGHRAIDTGGASLLESNEVDYLGIIGAKYKTRLLYQKGGDGAVATIAGGTIKNFDQLLYLDSDGSQFTLFQPSKFRLKECGLDNSVFDPAVHVGGLDQSSPDLIQVSLVDTSLCGTTR